VAVAALLSLALAGCGSPEERSQGYYESGMEYLEEGNVTKARLEFRNALQTKESHVPTLLALLEIEENAGDFQQIAAVLQALTEHDPENLEVQLKFGKLMLVAGQMERAVEISDIALAINDGDPGSLAFKGAVLLKLEDAASAVRYAEAALAIDPENIDGITVMAAERLHVGDVQGAIAYLDRGLASHERNIGLHLVKVQALSKIEDFDEAEAVIQRLIEFYPGEREFRRGLVRFYMGRGREDDAEREMRAIAENEPGKIALRLDVIRFLNSVRSSDAAVAELKSYIAEDPGNYAYNFMLAELKRSQGDGDGRITILQEIAESAGLEPEGLAARNLMAGQYLEDGDAVTARALIDEVLEADGRNTDALIYRASMAIERRELDDATQDLRTVQADSPESVRALMLLARLHDLNGATELAEDRYARALRFSKAHPSVGLPYVQFLLRQSLVERAEDVLIDVLTGHPRDIPSLQALAQVRLIRQDWLGAQEAAEVIRSINEGSEVPGEIMGRVLQAQNQYEQSIAAFQSAFDLAERKTKPLVALIRAYVRNGRLDDAEGFLDSLVESNNENYLAHLLLGQLLEVRDRPEEAAVKLNAAIAIEPENILAYNTLFAFYLRQEELEKSRQLITEGLAALPENFMLRLLSANLHELEKDFEAAITEYESLYAERPNSAIVANNLAALLTDYRDDNASHQRALVLSQRFRSSSVPQFKDTLGWTYHKLGDTAAAAALLADAVGQLPEFAVFRYHLGMSHLANNDQEAARRELERALELGKDSPFDQLDLARDALENLGAPE
jgi:pentatricopeptide repeat protein